MTELIFRDDAYARSCEARVVAVDERGIRLDRTVFYPTGCGQPPADLKRKNAPLCLPIGHPTSFVLLFRSGPILLHSLPVTGFSSP